MLISLLLVLGAIAYFLLPSETERETSEKPAQLSVKFDSTATVKIEISRPQKSLTLENVGGKWMITAPSRFPADPSPIFQLLGGLAKFRTGSLISSNPEKQRLFQVDSSGTLLKVTDRSGKSTSLMIGKTGPSYAEVYFRLPDSKDVYLGEGLEEYIVNKEPKDWRDKSVLTFPAESIHKVAYSVGSKQYEFSRDSTTWSSPDASLDAASVGTAVSSLSNFHADDFIDSLTTIPQKAVSIAAKGSETYSLRLAPVPPDSSRYYAQSSSSNQVFLVSKWTVQSILKPIEKHVIKPAPIAVAAPKPEPPKESPKVAPKELPKIVEKAKVSADKPAEPPKSKETPAKPKETPKEIPPKEKAPKVAKSVTPDSAPSAKVPPAPSNPLNNAPLSTPASSEDEGDLTVHTVKKGETMQTIAKKYNVSVERILKWNLLKSISVKPGQELYIYVKK